MILEVFEFFSLPTGAISPRATLLFKCDKVQGTFRHFKQYNLVKFLENTHKRQPTNSSGPFY